MEMEKRTLQITMIPTQAPVYAQCPQMKAGLLEWMFIASRW
jgi:hypothetical protein